MQIEKIDDFNWKVNDAEVWYHSQRNLYYCWACSSYTCDHIQAIRMRLTSDSTPLEKTDNWADGIIKQDVELLEDDKLCR